MSAFASAKSAFRCSSVRAAATKVSGLTKPTRASAFSLPKRRPLAHRIFRSPTEMSSACLESLMPFHSATASALLNSMLSDSRNIYCWNPEGEDK